MDRCSTCAFRPGTEASRSPLTVLKAKLCIQAGMEFGCHESPVNEPCAGYLAAVEVAAPETEWRRVLARELLELTDDVERYSGRLPEPDLFQWLHQRLGESAEALGAEAVEV